MARTGRPKWEPNEQQAQALNQLAALHAAAKAADARYRAALMEADEIGVAASAIAERLGYERKTIYRQLGHSKT